MSVGNKNKELTLESTDFIEVHWEQRHHKGPSVSENFEKMAKQVSDHGGK